MANVKITDLAAYTNPASTDVLAIVDVGTDVTKKVSIADLLENAGDGTAAAPAFSFDSDKNTGVFLEAADKLGFSTNGVGRVYIDGTGTFEATGQAVINDSGSPYFTVGLTVGAAMAIRSPDSNPSKLILVSETNHGTGIIESNGDNASGYLAFSTRKSGSTVERMRITPDGEVGVGTTSPAVECDVVGQVRASTGILFGSDTAAANALDDYEEGDWTPAFQGTTTPGTPVYGVNGQAGKYIKVGKMVQIMAYIVVTDIGGGAGNIQITGLPYNPNLTFFGSGIGTGHADGTLGNSVRLTNNSSSMLLRNNNSSVGVTTGSIYINCTYRTF